VLDLDPAADEVIRLLNGVTDDQLTGATPCADTSVGALLDHLMGLSLAFAWAARKSTRPQGRAAAPGRARPPRSTSIRAGAASFPNGSAS